MGHDHHSAHDSHAAGSHAAGHHEQHGSYATYISVFVALLVLTAISLIVGNSQVLREKTPRIMWAAMMAVSTAKAMLVILFFMHLKWEANWKYVLTIPASIMSVFLVLMLIPDVGQRTKFYSEERYLHSSEPAVHAEHHAEDKHHAPDAPEHTHAKE
jgi:cytochrome c oxidase subunit IV